MRKEVGVRWDWKKIGIAGSVVALTVLNIALPNKNLIVFEAGVVGMAIHVLTGLALMARHEGVSFREYMKRPMAGNELLSWGQLLTYPVSIPTGMVSLFVAAKLLGGG